ncbi:MAG: AAA domain-containing protein [Propionivibrio sp.]
MLNGYVARWHVLRDKLISGDGRSPSIRLQICRPGRSVDLYELESVSTGLAERSLAFLREGKRARLFDASEIGTHETARRVAHALVQLERERLTRYEETGADDLYLGYPFITGLAGGYLFRAPLILHPVRIERGARGAGAISLMPVSDAAPIANQSALRLIFHRKGYGYPDELAEKADELAAVGPEALLGELTLIELGAVGSLDRLLPFSDRREELGEWRDDRLEIEECAVLGLFPQSSSDLLQDYDDLLAALDKGVPPSDFFASARELLPADLRQTLQGEATVKAPLETTSPIPVLYADPVQRDVLVAARTAPALVVDGPPGTGKSQVIVNLVADALARGERVAVVCEKRAALDVVAHRLDGVGLRHLLAVVHDVHEDRRALYGQVAARLENFEPHGEDGFHRGLIAGEVDALMARLQQRAALTGITPSEHQGDSSYPLTLGQLHTFASGLDVDDPCRLDSLVQLPPSRLGPLATQISALFPLADLWRVGSPWRDPSDKQVRASFADYDNDKARGLMAKIVAAHEAATSFEQALTAAGLPQGGQGVDLLKGATKGLSAALVSRKWRDGDIGADAFVSLLTGGKKPDTVEHTQAAWHALIDSKVQRQNPERMRWFAELIAALAAQENGTGRLMELGRLWREHEAALDPYAEPVKFSIDPAFAQALADIRAQAGSVLRFLTPGWWRARKIVRSSLAVQWPEMAAAPIDQVLLTRIDGRASAARCWRGLFEVMDWLGFSQRPSSLIEGRSWIDATMILIGPARTLAACRTELQELGVWRAVPRADVIAAWDNEAERWIDWHLRAQSLRSQALVLDAEHSVLRALSAWPERWDIDSLAMWDQRIDCLHAAAKGMAALTTAAVPIREVLPWLPPLPGADVLRYLSEVWRRDASRLVGADRQVAMAQSVVQEAGVLPSHLADGEGFDSAENWADGVRKVWARVTLAALETRHVDLTMLDQTNGARLFADEARLAALSDEERVLAVQQILAKQDDSALLKASPAEKGARRTPEQATREAILREAKKQRSVLPLRGFVRRFWDNGLLDVLPVWLLSPETATLLFPRAPVFDLVIFDEASQCTVENGLPVLMRARRAVIAGDERQMPPSNFFKAADDNDEELSEAGIEAREMFDAESLLVLARHRTQRMGLAWHYRCRHEELIAFSNHAIYGGDLNTIPSTVSRLAPAAVRWVDVPDGAYENGVNVPEARVVIDQVEHLLQRPDKPSLGIVTFNLTQRRAILDEIDRRISADASFAELWLSANAVPRIDDRPFVKNLESVQGDERDIIVFSLGHAPIERVRRNGQIERYVPARFGPLGQRGGERRLNVAVSRAKQEIFVIASFDPHMLSVARSKNDGPRLFKGFLQFAHQLSAGQRNQAEQTLKAIGGTAVRVRDADASTRPESWVPLNAQVALSLEKLGIKCELDVGTSGFRVPLAVLDPADPGCYRLGILFDETIPADAVFERHIHIPNVLTGRGWKLMRISSREWDLNRASVLAEICSALGRGEVGLTVKASDSCHRLDQTVGCSVSVD